MKISLFIITLLVSIMCISCNKKQEAPVTNTEEFDYNVDRFADLSILRYKVKNFDNLGPKQKRLVYYLSQAALEGRDIIFDQNYKHNLVIRRTLEAIYGNYKGDRDNEQFRAFEVYLKRVWFSNGIHHHYSTDKFMPDFDAQYFESLLANIEDSLLPLQQGEDKAALIAKLEPILFDSTVDAKRVNQNHEQDLIATSANNYWGDGISQIEAEAFYDKMIDRNDSTPISYGLNSRLEKKDGKIIENTWKLGGTYSPAIEKILYWLEKATTVTENHQQLRALELLINFYKTGDLKTYDDYCIAWLEDQNSMVDFVNGFTETYGDPLGMKASWESVVNFKDVESTHRTIIISRNAQWFENNSPVDSRFKKEKVLGVTAKVITAAMLGGDCYPATPIGINLPNADWIRKEYGSKSVTIENITLAYYEAKKGNGFIDEFAYSQEEIDRSEKYGFVSDNLHTDLHECLGHGSGQLLPGVTGGELKAYGATIEEARADLFALYYLGDKMMIDLDLLPDAEAYKAEYDGYIRNGLMTQLTRIRPGDQIEESHMRNRSLIAHWVYEKGDGKVIKKVSKDGKTFFVISDYVKLRELFKDLLCEVQRIKSEGDFNAAKSLVENYGVKVDAQLHKEVLERFEKLNIAPYSGFVNPVYKAVTNEAGEITDITVDYTEDYVEQMMRYSREHSWLPDYN